MGWTFSHREKGMSNREWFEHEFPQTLTVNGEVVADGTIRRTYYAAVRDHSDGRTWALVVPMQWVPRDYYNFGYKEMDESVGPCEDDAPAKVLAALTPTDSEWANAWRDRCHVRLIQKVSAPKVKPGDRVRFAEPIAFQNGCELAELTFEARSSFREGYARYNIPRWRERDYSIVQKETVA